MISAGASRGVDVDMQQNFDAIIIGAGIIGAAIAFEMARGGRRTLNIDRLPAAGYGSTSHSCAIIRVYYSTVDATALACDSYFHWKDWAGYLGAEDERGHAVFHDCGTLVMKTEQNGHCRRSMAIMSELGIPFEEWDAERIRETLPPYDLAGFAPAKRMEDDDFGKSNGSTIDGAVFFPQGGYVSDPQLATHNLQRAAEAHGAAFRFNAEVTEILREDGRVGGVRLADGSRIKELRMAGRLREQVAAGLLAIARLDRGYELVPKGVAEKIMQRDTSAILVLNTRTDDSPDEDDPYAAFQVPDDLMW